MKQLDFGEEAFLERDRSRRKIGQNCGMWHSFNQKRMKLRTQKEIDQELLKVSKLYSAYSFPSSPDNRIPL